ncbi:MAG: cell division protein ZapB [Treponema sp.]|jgi:TolA-binding protein|nr:cell division protein ZapB [Treponema sp.]
MVSLEQVKLLETKVARAIEYVERVTGENALLQDKLESYQKRIDELEVLVRQFKEDQGRIEDGILSALDRLNQFEDAIEKSLSAPGGKEAEKAPPAAPKAAPESAAADTVAAFDPAPADAAAEDPELLDGSSLDEPSLDDLADADAEDPPAKGNGELDIF